MYFLNSFEIKYVWIYIAVLIAYTLGLSLHYFSLLLNKGIELTPVELMIDLQNHECYYNYVITYNCNYTYAVVIIHNFNYTSCNCV